MPTLLLHALPTRHTVSLQTTCQANLAPLSLSLSGLQSAMRLVANTGVHCIQHGSRPLDIKLSGSHCDHGCCSLSWPLSPPLNSQSKMEDSASLTFRASLQRAQHLLDIYCLSRAVFLTLTLPSWERGWHFLSVAGSEAPMVYMHIVVGSRLSEVPEELKLGGSGGGGHEQGIG